ncbi:hypothetical protein [Streptomyces sp. NPDC058583]|uniref:hypothetical protein n=1 Tax=unclassified Streptomyces TaxID=2593676 RepID=UPI00364B4673
MRAIRCDWVVHVAVEGVEGAGGLGHAAGGDRAGVDSAGAVAQGASGLSAQDAADDGLVHRGERADGVQSERLEPGGLGRADAVQGREELFDGAVAWQVQDSGGSGVRGGGRGVAQVSAMPMWVSTPYFASAWIRNRAASRPARPGAGAAGRRG